LRQFEQFFPGSITQYREVFLGGGAVFFHLKARFPGMRATLRDNNPELINCYQTVRDQAEELMLRLDAHLEQFRTDAKAHYGMVRSQHRLTEPLDRAARMIFLNKTCYNGLWRVNGRGEFNVPIGSYRPEKVSLYDRANFLAASRALQGVDLAVADFRASLNSAAKDDFVYVDPPYLPVSATANFTSYTKELFGKKEQSELARLFAEAAGRGARLMLYPGFKIETVKARRAVNCDGAKRGLVSEVIVMNY
jgi:DNA adenine methylase